MILTCNSCEKKFIVPDSAITDSGRLVQCSSCGNKWKQFPIAVKSDLKTKTTKIKPQPKINQTKKVKREDKQFKKIESFQVRYNKRYRDIKFNVPELKLATPLRLRKIRAVRSGVVDRENNQ